MADLEIQETLEIQVSENSTKAENSRKRARVEDENSPEEMMEKITRHCSCTVCLDVPAVALYQCKNGHLMCYTCLNHLLADARLKEEQPNCPNCRCEIGLDSCMRNLAAEKAVGEIPTECSWCAQMVNRCNIEAHERHRCNKRPSKCRFNFAGCDWKGPLDKLETHVKACKFKFATCESAKDEIEKAIDKESHRARVKDNILNLFAFDSVIYTDFLVRSYRTDDYIPKLAFESNRQRIFNDEWILSCEIRGDSSSTSRQILFSMTLKNRPQFSRDIQLFVTRAPGSDFQLDHVTYLHRFTKDATSSPFFSLPLKSAAEINRFISSKSVNLRVYMFEMNEVERRGANRENQRANW